MKKQKIEKEMEKLQKLYDVCTTREDEKAILLRFDELQMMLDEKNKLLS